MILGSCAASVAPQTAARGFFSWFYDWSVAGCSIPKRRQFYRTAVVNQWRPAFSNRKIHSSFTRQHRDPSKDTHPFDEPALSSHLRDLMRIMPHSVVVATASSPADNLSSSQAFKGMTVSSFTTLTMTPTPIITFNIRKPSQTLDAIRKSREFMIHILPATEAGARIADTFTKGNTTDVFRSESFEVLQVKGKGPPLLAGEGVLRVLRCKVREEPEAGLVEVGDHVLILGDVMGIIEPPGSDLGQLEGGGLCYLDRRYRQVGEKINLASASNGA